MQRAAITCQPVGATPHDGEDDTDKIQVAAAFRVPDVASTCAGEDYGQRVVVVCSIGSLSLCSLVAGGGMVLGGVRGFSRVEGSGSRLEGGATAGLREARHCDGRHDGYSTARLGEEEMTVEEEKTMQGRDFSLP